MRSAIYFHIFIISYIQRAHYRKVHNQTINFPTIWIYIVHTHYSFARYVHIYNILCILVSMQKKTYPHYDFQCENSVTWPPTYYMHDPVRELSNKLRFFFCFFFSFCYKRHVMWTIWILKPMWIRTVCARHTPAINHNYMEWNYPIHYNSISIPGHELFYHLPVGVVFVPLTHV